MFLGEQTPERITDLLFQFVDSRALRTQLGAELVFQFELVLLLQVQEAPQAASQHHPQPILHKPEVGFFGFLGWFPFVLL